MPCACLGSSRGVGGHVPPSRRTSFIRQVGRASPMHMRASDTGPSLSMQGNWEALETGGTPSPRVVKRSSTPKRARKKQQSRAAAQCSLTTSRASAYVVLSLFPSLARSARSAPVLSRESVVVQGPRRGRRRAQPGGKKGLPASELDVFTTVQVAGAPTPVPV